ncbi:hypothetical protein [Winogradskyella forsetii]|uniref:hypothetical protein n=1 Tax=Winogradskyella forsetii TaxID=2686077 RepID=UPI0015BD83AA|nr:hypothetical protein [Winogradskyella forsetii]
MSFYNKDKNPFPFYKLEGEVWTNTKPLWFRTNCKSCCYKHRLGVGNAFFQLPISNEVTSAAQVSVNIRKVGDNTIVNGIAITKNVLVDSNGGKYVIINSDLQQSLVGDEYYISVDTTFNKYYSEPFCVSQLTDKYVSIEWSNSNTFVGALVYANNFKHVINVEAVIVPRESEIEEETEEDGFGNETPTLQILKQGYQLSFVVPNFIAQALAALPLHDMVNFINRTLGETSTELIESNKYVKVEVSPELDNCFSFVTIQYTDEIVTKTNCTNDVVFLNSPPITTIFWEDTGTNEDRVCQIDGTCEQTMMANVIDPDGNLETIEWQRSDDLGLNWVSFSFAGTTDIDTRTITETDLDSYQYRVKATDVNGMFGYSNILKYNLYDDLITPSLELEIASLTSNCSSQDAESEGVTNIFDIAAGASQLVKAKLEVTEYFGSGFVFQLLDLGDSSVLSTWTGGPIGTNIVVDIPLDSEGSGQFATKLCLNSCSGTTYTRATVLMTLLDIDNITETNQTLITEKYIIC